MNSSSQNVGIINLIDFSQTIYVCGMLECSHTHNVSSMTVCLILQGSETLVNFRLYIQPLTDS